MGLHWREKKCVYVAKNCGYISLCNNFAQEKKQKSKVCVD